MIVSNDIAALHGQKGGNGAYQGCFRIDVIILCIFEVGQIFHGLGEFVLIIEVIFILTEHPASGVGIVRPVSTVFYGIVQTGLGLKKVRHSRYNLVTKTRAQEIAGIETGEGILGP